MAVQVAHSNVTNTVPLIDNTPSMILRRNHLVEAVEAVDTEDCHFEVLMVVATTADSNTGHTAHIALNNHSNFPMKLVK